jgi:hypothetical protein
VKKGNQVTPAAAEKNVAPPHLAPLAAAADGIDQEKDEGEFADCRISYGLSGLEEE